MSVLVITPSGTYHVLDKDTTEVASDAMAGRWIAALSPRTQTGAYLNPAHIIAIVEAPDTGPERRKVTSIDTRLPRRVA